MNSASLAGGVVEDNDALRLDEIRILVGVVEDNDAMRLDGRVCITGASSFEGIGSCLLGVLENVSCFWCFETFIQERKALFIIGNSARKSCHTRLSAHCRSFAQ